MNKYFLITAIFGLVLFGCTGPTQPIAMDALDRGVAQYNSVFNDMGRIAKQEVLNSTANQVFAAVEAQNVDAAKTALQSGFNKRDDIEWLYIQKERAAALVSVAQQYIASQKGILNIWYDEWQEATENVEQATSQPSK